MNIDEPNRPRETREKKTGENVDGHATGGERLRNDTKRRENG